MRGKKMAIIGGGLIGGSLAAGLKKAGNTWEITCLDLPSAVTEIEESGIFDHVNSIEEMGPVLKDCEVVVLAATVDAIIELLEKIGPHLQKSTVVTDVGSTKVGIEKRAKDTLPSGIHFVGGHPITGSEESGVAAANPFLFKNKPYVLCPEMNTDEAAFLTIMNMVQELGAIPVSVDSEEHDLVMAMVSHAPQLVAVALMQAAVKLDSTHGILDMVAGRGFMDMTRIAASGYDMWKGILATNRNAVESALDAFEESLSQLRTAIKEGDPSPLWDSARLRRKGMGPRKPDRYSERDLRTQIDALDAQLLKVVLRRLQVVEKIGAAKQKKGLPVFDPKREEQVKEQWSEFGNAFGLSDALITDLLSVLTDHSKRAQA